MKLKQVVAGTAIGCTLGTAGIGPPSGVATRHLLHPGTRRAIGPGGPADRPQVDPAAPRGRGPRQFRGPGGPPGDDRGPGGPVVPRRLPRAGQPGGPADQKTPRRPGQPRLAAAVEPEGQRLARPVQRRPMGRRTAAVGLGRTAAAGVGRTVARGVGTPAAADQLLRLQRAARVGPRIQPVGLLFLRDLDSAPGLT